ncbi:long-chain acyl-CoA synthetase [Balneicella halophila]|uniref:Long-chain acyl-CoA synthetase n=1 Tax=Balneicella halophila TaxID=1537566 RepID=A0A7L4UTF6_BALHA|nr:AMP-binding protein [Balneicella halophila]PVX52647.1 long-chain acyl-CoA synthetase [Balneicella halophila]
MKKTIPQLLEESVKRYATKPFLLEETNGKYQSTSFEEVATLSNHFGAGLLTLGINYGDRIALLSEGQNSWVISELGMLYIGAICVPLSVKLELAKDLSFRINHSECTAVVVSRQQLPKIRKLKGQLPTVKHIIVLNKLEEYQEEEISYKEIIERGKEFIKANTEQFQTVLNTVTPNTIANISYTSGTTSSPKGIMLSHNNYVANVEQSVKHMKDFPSYYKTLLILPWDHAFGHTAGVFSFLKTGASIASVNAGKSPIETLRNIPRNLKQINPYILLSVPALAINFRKNIESGIRKNGKFAQSLFNRGLKVAYKYNKEGHNKGPWYLKPIVAFYDTVIFSKVRKSFASNMQYFVGGGALLDIELQRFYYAIGIPMYQGYGLSEASPVISANTPHSHKLGSSGKPLPDMEIKIVDEEWNECPTGEKGEIIIKGENVMLGYWKNEKATKETLVNGWLHTGDLGYLDKDGYLYVLGRSKSLLIGSDGEKFSPEGIEEALISNSPYIEQAVLYNNQNPVTTGILVVNPDKLKQQTSHAEEALTLIQKEVDSYLKGGKLENLFPERWLPSTFAIIEEPFTEKNGMVNSTMKIIRHKVHNNYKERIDNLYSDGKQTTANKNIEILNKILK